MADIVKLHRSVRPSSQRQVWAVCGDPINRGGEWSFAAGSTSGCYWDDNRDAALGRYGLVLRPAHQSPGVDAVGGGALDEGKGTVSRPALGDKC
ncbi:hypothetical protein FIU86_06715 [Roseovarius sp. THAF9]|nr:hypothetical protein FIU86_06715 [Roseovarius sp. THAF9]